MEQNDRDRKAIEEWIRYVDLGMQLLSEILRTADGCNGNVETSEPESSAFPKLIEAGFPKCALALRTRASPSDKTCGFDLRLGTGPVFPI